MDRSKYDASYIDWDRLKKYAQRVARETAMPLNPPLTYRRTTYTDTPVTKTTSGFLGFGSRSYVVHERRPVCRDVQAVGPYWPIDLRHWHKEENTRNGNVRIQETNHEYHTLALLPDGSLVMAIISETEVINFRESQAKLVHHEQGHSIRAVNESDVVALDFQKCHRESGRHNVGTMVWGNWNPGKRLLRHAKGVGINLALKDLLEGRTPRDA